MKAERTALLLSAGVALLIGVVASVAALLIGSGAIMLDGAFNLSFVVVALVTLKVASLVQRADDEDFPFGYFQFEPLVNAVKGLLILGVSIVALIDAGMTVADGGRPLAAGNAIAYGVFATLACGATLVVLARLQRRAKSPLVAGDIANWTVNTAISGAMLVAFLVALVLQLQGLEALARYVDPVLVALVVTASLAVPVRILGGGLMALLNRSVGKAAIADIEARVRGALGALPVAAIHVRAVKPGRTTNVLVHVVLAPARATLTVAEADGLRERVLAAVHAGHAPLLIDVMFTANARFAAPAAAMTPAEPPPAETADA